MYCRLKHLKRFKNLKVYVDKKLYRLNYSQSTEDELVWFMYRSKMDVRVGVGITDSSFLNPCILQDQNCLRRGT